MISVLKNNDEVIVWCSSGEQIDVKKIKSIASTIKRIHRNKREACKIVIRSADNVNFNLSGKMFYDKIKSSRLIVNNKISFNYEK